MLAGTLAAVTRNVHRSKTTDKVWTWDDFFPRAKKHSSAWQTAEDLDKTLMSFDAYARAKRKQNAKPSRPAR